MFKFRSNPNFSWGMVGLFFPGELLVSPYFLEARFHPTFLRPKKVNVLFQETSEYFLGSVGRQNKFFR